MGGLWGAPGEGGEEWQGREGGLKGRNDGRREREAGRRK